MHTRVGYMFKKSTGDIEMTEQQGNACGINASLRSHLAAGLLLLVVSVLLLPIGVVLRDSIAGSPAANGF